MNGETQLLKQLAWLANEEDAGSTAGPSDRWDSLAHGRLSHEEISKLEREAQSSPDARDSFDAFSPLGADFQQRIARHVKAQAPEATHYGQDGVQVSPSWGRPLLALAASALLVLGLLWVVWPWSKQARSLPSYSATWPSGVRSERVEEPTSTQSFFEEGSRFDLLLRPKTDVWPVEAVFFSSQGHGWQPWPVAPEVSDGGAVRVSGEIGTDLQLPAGSSSLMAAVGRPGRIPSPEEIASLMGTNSEIQTATWAAWIRHVTLSGED